MIPHDLARALRKADGMCEALSSINLEISERQGHLRGRLTEPDGPAHEFEGWLGLLSVLGRLLDQGSRHCAATAPRQTPEHDAQRT